MELQWHRDHIDQLKTQLEHFQLMHHRLEVFYQRSKQFQGDPMLRSALMECYSVQVDRQQKAVEAMAELYQRAKARLEALEAKKRCI